MYGKATKLVNAVPHRWISTCNVLEEILRSWAALEEHYMKNEQGGSFPLAAHKTEVEELYSLMKPIAVLMKDSQQTGVPTGLDTFISLVMLRCTTLDTSKPLTITVPRKALAGEGGTTTTTSIDRPAASLQTVTTYTREKLFVGVTKRFFAKRYDEAVVATPPAGFVFEMAACMSPCFVQLQWLPAVCSSETEAKRVDKVIKDKVVDLMVRMAEGVGAKSAEKNPGGEDSDSGKSAEPRQKRKAGPFDTAGGSASSNAATSEKTKKLLASGVFGGSSSDSNAKEKQSSVVTLRQACQQEFDRFQQRFKGATLDDYPLADLLPFWINEGLSIYPNMARVARVLLSVPASSAVLERDFSTAGRLITGSRSSLSAAYAEMVLFLNGNQDYIPIEVPALSTEQALQAVPRRLSNPTAEVVALSVGEGKDDDTCDEYEEESLTSIFT